MLLQLLQFHLILFASCFVYAYFFNFFGGFVIFSVYFSANVPTHRRGMNFCLLLFSRIATASLLWFIFVRVQATLFAVISLTRAQMKQQTNARTKLAAARPLTVAAAVLVTRPGHMRDFSLFL